MTEPDPQRIRDIRHRLLVLHKQLLDVEREQYEREHGRIAPADFLRLLIEDTRLAWLRPMTELIVRIDEWLDDADRTAELARVWLDELRRLLAPTPALHEFHRRYDELMQLRAEIVVAHGAMMQALRFTDPGS